MLATLGPRRSLTPVCYSMPLFHFELLDAALELRGGLDKWRMADRAASRGSQLAMSSNGFNTTTTPPVSYSTAHIFAQVIPLGAKHYNSQSTLIGDSYGPHPTYLVRLNLCAMKSIKW